MLFAMARNDFNRRSGVGHHIGTINPPKEDQSAGPETVYAELREVLGPRFELKLGYQQIGRSCAIAVSTT